MSNLVDFAKTELALLRGPSPEPDEMQDALRRTFLRLLRRLPRRGIAARPQPTPSVSLRRFYALSR